MSSDLSKATLGELNAGTRGLKTASLISPDGPVFWRPSETALHVPFAPSAWNNPEATRVSMCLRATPEIEQQCEELDAWICKEVTAKSEQFFKKKLSPTEIQNSYMPCLRQSDNFPSLFRFKLNLSGSNAVRCWGEDKTARALPGNWRNVSVVPKLWIKGIFFQNKDWGLLLECTDILLHEAEQGCPF